MFPFQPTFSRPIGPSLPLLPEQNFIRDFIANQRENVSAIIVSHNIPLTLDFADRIIVLSKRENGISTIDPHFIYDREDLKWYDSSDVQNRIQKEGPAKPTVKQSEPDLGTGKSA